MDFSKIKLENERNGHLKKRLNRLSAWGFFKVLYRNNMWRLMGYSILMIICCAPVLALFLLSSLKTAQLMNSLPYYGSFGMGTGVWLGVQSHYNLTVSNYNDVYGAFMVAGGLALAFIFSGGFAVIRDAFWTGGLKVFRCMGMGIAANIPYALVSALLISASVYGCFEFFVFAQTVMPLWLAIVLLVILCIAALLLMTYLMILCSVSVTYKQSVGQNLSDSWRLMWLNFLPNIIHIILALLPIGLYFLFSGGMLQILFLVFLLMFGGMYFPHVWQTHMMKTFALFHPVQVNKKGETKAAPAVPQKAGGNA